MYKHHLHNIHITENDFEFNVKVQKHHFNQYDSMVEITLTLHANSIKFPDPTMRLC